MVNINDIDESDLSLKTYYDILARQKELMEYYKTFDDGIIDLDLNKKAGQNKLKSLLWRITEEISEAREAAQKKEYKHFKEELIDSMHFLLEVLILLNFEDKIIVKIMANSISPLYKIKYESEYLHPDEVLLEIYTLYGLAGNFLKNKSWKRTIMETDCNTLFEHLVKTATLHFYYINMFLKDEMIRYYDLKSLVNLFRIRSMY